MNGTQLGQDFWAGIQGKAALDVAWPLVEKLVEDILEQAQGEHTKQDIYQAVLEKKMQLWVICAYEGIAITEIILWPQLGVLNVVGLAGVSVDRAERLCRQVLVPFAQEKGLQKIRNWGRRGLAKVLKSKGWREVYVVTEIDV